MTSDPYATWDPSRATDDPDGLPDRKIVPLIEFLRERSIVTLQSCYGHEGRNDGHLWVVASTVTDTSVHAVMDTDWDRRIFDKISRVVWPEDRWEFAWEPSRASLAVSILQRLTVT